MIDIMSDIGGITVHIIDDQAIYADMLSQYLAVQPALTGRIKCFTYIDGDDFAARARGEILAEGRKQIVVSDFGLPNGGVDKVLTTIEGFIKEGLKPDNLAYLGISGETESPHKAVINKKLAVKDSPWARIHTFGYAAKTEILKLVHAVSGAFNLAPQPSSSKTP